MTFNVERCLISKNGAKPLWKNTWIPSFLEVKPKKYLLHDLCGRNMWAKCHKNVSGKFGKIRAKILRTPKNSPAPAPVDELLQLQFRHRECKQKQRAIQLQFVHKLATLLIRFRFFWLRSFRLTFGIKRGTYHFNLSPFMIFKQIILLALSRSWGTANLFIKKNTGFTCRVHLFLYAKENIL